ncbi:MAG TPA: DVUA0089 family protein [Nitrosospira sp.]|nr:DVUA0089 family protein [Nitrosospira sp.]
MKTFGAIIAISLTAGSANAADFSFAGEFNHNDEVQEFNFTVAEAAADVTLRTWSFAGGTNAQGTVIERGGFDPIVSLFDGSTAAQISHNDDGGLVHDPVSGLSYDSFLMNNLSAGSYTATVTQYRNFPVGTLADGFGGSFQTNFSDRDSHWALDVLNVESASLGASYISAVGPIPEPETYALLLAGLGLIGFMIRFRQV